MLNGVKMIIRGGDPETVKSSIINDIAQKNGRARGRDAFESSKSSMNVKRITRDDSNEDRWWYSCISEASMCGCGNQ